MSEGAPMNEWILDPRTEDICCEGRRITIWQGNEAGIVAELNSLEFQLAKAKQEAAQTIERELGGLRKANEELTAQIAGLKFAAELMQKRIEQLQEKPTAESIEWYTQSLKNTLDGWDSMAHDLRKLRDETYKLRAEKVGLERELQDVNKKLAAETERANEQLNEGHQETEVLNTALELAVSELNNWVPRSGPLQFTKENLLNLAREWHRLS